MAARVPWLRILTKNHQFRAISKKPEPENLQKKSWWQIGPADYLMQLIKIKDRKAHGELSRREEEGREISNKFIYDEGGHYSEAHIVHNQRVEALLMQHHMKETLWVENYLKAHPEIRKRFLRKGYTRALMQQRFYGQTEKNRLLHVDSLVSGIIREQGLHPTSFLDIGAAFQPIPMRSYDKAPEPAQTTIDARNFFKSQGHEMKFYAVDVVPLAEDPAESKQKRGELISKGVLAFQKDYRTTGFSRKYSIVRLANVSANQSRKEFVETVTRAVEALEPNGLLIVYNETSRALAPGLDMMQVPGRDLGIYQKTVDRGTTHLRQIMHEKKG